MQRLIFADIYRDVKMDQKVQKLSGVRQTINLVDAIAKIIYFLPEASGAAASSAVSSFRIKASAGAF